MTNQNTRHIGEDARECLFYAQEMAKLEFAADLHAFMERQGIKQKIVAKALNKSEAFVSKALCGNTNLTIDSMVALAFACDGKVHLKVADVNSSTRWFEVLESKTILSRRNLNRAAEAWASKTSHQESFNGRHGISPENCLVPAA
jgi:transcriptional regulator with XRE-family HTH domain